MAAHKSHAVRPASSASGSTAGKNETLYLFSEDAWYSDDECEEACKVGIPLMACYGRGKGVKPFESLRLPFVVLESLKAAKAESSASSTTSSVSVGRGRGVIVRDIPVKARISQTSQLEQPVKCRSESENSSSMCSSIAPTFGWSPSKPLSGASIFLDYDDCENGNYRSGTHQALFTSDDENFPPLSAAVFTGSSSHAASRPETNVKSNSSRHFAGRGHRHAQSSGILANCVSGCDVVGGNGLGSFSSVASTDSGVSSVPRSATIAARSDTIWPFSVSALPSNSMCSAAAGEPTVGTAAASRPGTYAFARGKPILSQLKQQPVGFGAAGFANVSLDKCSNSSSSKANSLPATRSSKPAAAAAAAAGQLRFGQPGYRPETRSEEEFNAAVSAVGDCRHPVQQTSSSDGTARHIAGTPPLGSQPQSCSRPPPLMSLYCPPPPLLPGAGSGMGSQTAGLPGSVGLAASPISSEPAVGRAVQQKTVMHQQPKQKQLSQRSSQLNQRPATVLSSACSKADCDEKHSRTLSTEADSKNERKQIEVSTTAALGALATTACPSNTNSGLFTDERKAEDCESTTAGRNPLEEQAAAGDTAVATAPRLADLVGLADSPASNAAAAAPADSSCLAVSLLDGEQCAILIKGVRSAGNCDDLRSLLEMYGDIKEITSLSSDNALRVRFESEESCREAMTYLDGFTGFS